MFYAINTFEVWFSTFTMTSGVRLCKLLPHLGPRVMASMKVNPRCKMMLGAGGASNTLVRSGGGTRFLGCEMGWTEAVRVMGVHYRPWILYAYRQLRFIVEDGRSSAAQSLGESRETAIEL